MRQSPLELCSVTSQDGVQKQNRRKDWDKICTNLWHAAVIEILQYCDVSHNTGPVVPSTIPAPCCAIPFTLNGDVHYGCVDNGTGDGCYYGDREWKLCQHPAGKCSMTLHHGTASVNLSVRIRKWVFRKGRGPMCTNLAIARSSMHIELKWWRYFDRFPNDSGSEFSVVER